MTITAVCSSCGKRFEAPPQFAGKRVKCKSCGTVFQIQAAPAPASDENSELDALEELEKSAAGAEADPSNGSTVRSRLVPRDEKQLKSNPFAEEIPVAGPRAALGRANVLYFRYPGARQVDQWLPLGLLLLGLIGLAAVIAGTRDSDDLTWIAVCRFVVCVFFYFVIIFPITLSMLRKAGREIGYRPPPSVRLRTFSVYMPAFAMAASFWFAGNGSLMGLILGALFGLGLSSAALWLLFRLREEELAGSVSYGAGGFMLGAVISMPLILGLNLLTALVVSHTQAVAKVPASPFSPGLSWPAAPPPPAVGVKKAAPSPSVVQTHLDETPASPIVSSLSIDKIPGPINVILRPLSNSPTIGVVRTGDNNSATIEAWDTTTWQKIGTELKLASPVGQYALSYDGQSLVYVDHFPRLCVKTWSFVTATLASPRIDLDAKIGEPRLMGFCAPNRLLIRWIGPDQIKPDPANSAQPLAIQVLDTTSAVAGPGFMTEPIEPGHATTAISTATQRLAVACKLDSGPALLQYDLNNGKLLSGANIQVSEIDPNLKVSPTGLAYSSDGKQLGVLFEYNGGAVLETYDALHGGKHELDLEYPAWPPDGVSIQGFADNCLAWLDPSPALLVYGQGVIATATSKTVTTLSVPGVIGQSILAGDRIELIVNQGLTRRIVIATIDRTKLDALVSPTTQPATP